MRDAILIGIVLAGLVLFVFLRNTQVILIAMIVVPAVLAITVLLLSVLGMSFNIMTLGGMAAAVGLIIDDVDRDDRTHHAPAATRATARCTSASPGPRWSSPGR